MTLPQKVAAVLRGATIPVTTTHLVLLVKRRGERNVKGKVWGALLRMEKCGAVRRVKGCVARVPAKNGSERTMWCNGWLPTRAG